jgi:hypothetical protein
MVGSPLPRILHLQEALQVFMVMLRRPAVMGVVKVGSEFDGLHKEPKEPKEPKT